MHVSVRQLTKSYGSLRALDQVSLEIAPGQIVAVVGANGAGKTTLLRCLAGVAGPDAGEILFDRAPFTRDRLDLRRRLAFLPDTPAYHAGMSVLRHIATVLRAYDVDPHGAEERVVELLRDFDLLPLAESPLPALSRGQAYKAALAAVLAVDPEIWLLDEPFSSGMDPRGLASFRRHLRQAATRGRTILYSTQILEVAERFADRLCILHRGHVYACEGVEEIRRRHAGRGTPLEELFQQLDETP
jgi:ABC-type multidrug transport system ATPase subunit